MDADAMGTIFTLLIALGLLAAVVGRFAGPDVHLELRANALRGGAIVATGAMLGSLYFSEIENFTPCEYCWYQRIAMYPLAVILIVAAVRDDRRIRPYATILAAGGAAVSLYHYQLQVWPDQGSSCSIDTPCTFRWIEIFGFVSIPLLALGSFILVLLLLYPPSEPLDTTPTPQQEAMTS